MESNGHSEQNFCNTLYTLHKLNEILNLIEELINNNENNRINLFLTNVLNDVKMYIEITQNTINEMC